MIDSHTHLNFIKFKDSWRQVIAMSQSSGIRALLVVGTNITTSQRAITIAREFDNVFAAVGIHPHHVHSFDSNTSIHKAVKAIDELANDPTVVAIGEVGLDRHLYKVSQYSKELQTADEEQAMLQQKFLLAEQAKISFEKNLPLILHSREAKREVLTTLIEASDGEVIRGVFHCFDGSKKYAKEIISHGLYVSFTGNITYSQDRLEVAKEIPLDRLLLETDSPYMSPAPQREEVNTPINLPLIAKAHAQSRSLSTEQIIEATSANATSLFKLTLF